MAKKGRRGYLRKPVCPLCGSRQVRFAIRRGLWTCRVCRWAGHGIRYAQVPKCKR